MRTGCVEKRIYAKKMISLAHVEHFEGFVVISLGGKFISTDALGFGVQFNQNTQKHYLKTDQRWINSIK